MTEFVPFSVPVHPDDQSLVRWDRDAYACTGCGGRVPDGAFLFEFIENGMITGLRVRQGFDGPVVHECGSAVIDDG